MPIRFQLNGREVEVDGIPPTTTLLQFLREHRRLCGTKEGCAEGDCGACSVTFAEADGLRTVDACLILLPMVHGRRVWTVEGLAASIETDAPGHPAQLAVVDTLASQCGYCTPGVVMSLVEACHRTDLDRDWQIDDQMCGNLCRCTGYRPIREAARRLAGTLPEDGPARDVAALRDASSATTPISLELEVGEQSWQTPATWEEYFRFLDGHPSARLVCGGTDLALGVTQRHERPGCLVSVESLPGLRVLEADETGFRIGAAVPLADVERWAVDALPILARMLRYFGSRQIKHRATIGGNVCNASPIGDTPPVLLALDAKLVAHGRGGERSIPIDEFFTGYRETALRQGEVLVRIELPRVSPQTRLGAYKVSRRREMDISAVAGAFMVQVEEGRVDDVRLAFGGMAATPARARHVEDALRGRTWTADALETALTRLDEDFTPIDDQRASAWYRRTVAANLLRGFYEETLETRFRALPDRPLSTIVASSDTAPSTGNGEGVAP